jgi:CheY-like chemotaxis protein
MAASTATSSPHDPGKPVVPTTILVVEDEVLIRLMISEYLREFGYTVVEARNATEATRILRTEEPVQVVFSDVRMPGDMNGLGLAKWIAHNRPEIGVVLTSAHVAPTDLPEQPEDLRNIVRKPYAPNEVLQRIRAITARMN